MNHEYKLVFCEEFDYEGKPDSSKWVHEIGGKKWGNKELQFYTDKLDNSFVQNNRLTIRAQIEKTGEWNYTSARLMTYGKHSWMYGRFEIVAKLPKGQGSWPAIWMLSDAIKKGSPWPYCGEIDIMEHVGRDPNKIHFSLHTGAFNHRVGNHKTFFQKFDAVSDSFHAYRMDWEKDQITFYVDNERIVTYKKEEGYGVDEWPFDQPFYLILNIAVGGTWGGLVDDSLLPFEMEVRSVKVWQQS